MYEYRKLHRERSHYEENANINESYANSESYSVIGPLEIISWTLEREINVMFFGTTHKPVGKK